MVKILAIQAMILPTTLPVKLPLLFMFPLDQVISYDHRNIFVLKVAKLKPPKTSQDAIYMMKVSGEHVEGHW